MEMSPRVPRSARSSPGCDPPPGHLTSPPSDTVLTDIWRRPAELPQRNGRPPGPLTVTECGLPGDGLYPEPPDRQTGNGHGPPEMRSGPLTAEDGPPHPERSGEDGPHRPEPPQAEDDEEEQETHEFWREPLRFIDDSSEAS